MNSFKNSERFFKWIDIQFSSNYFDPSLFPKSWLVSYSYLRGRFFLYNNDFENAR
jgi:hypothetical protein